MAHILKSFLDSVQPQQRPRGLYLGMDLHDTNGMLRVPAQLSNLLGRGPCGTIHAWVLGLDRCYCQFCELSGLLKVIPHRRQTVIDHWCEGWRVVRLV